MTRATDADDQAAGAETIGRIVIALFDRRSEAESAVGDLKRAGFDNEQIGIATQDQVGGEGSPEGMAETEEAPGRVMDERTAGPAEGAAVGAVTGGLLGGLLGLISSILIPGLGPLVVGGVLASTLMGMGVGAATGGLIGALVTMGVPEEEARYFESGLREGRTLVTVADTRRAPEALAILESHGGDLGPSRSRLTAGLGPGGRERRLGLDSSYVGPERRYAGT
jgi:hypothetical protein